MQIEKVSAAEAKARFMADGASGEKVEKFFTFYQKRPELWKAFVKTSVEAARRGIRRWGAKAVFEVIRYEAALEGDKGEGEFKVCNTWAPYYARLLTYCLPQLSDFFEFKRFRS